MKKFISAVLGLALLVGCSQQAVQSLPVTAASSVSSFAHRHKDNKKIKGLTWPYGTVVWQAGDPILGNWETANTYQCGNPEVVGKAFYFILTLDGQKCGRNQMLPLTAGGSTFQLTAGSIYTWKFKYTDGSLTDQPPGMGDDLGEAQSVVWQIHGNTEGGTPCTQLGFGNTPTNSNSGQPQVWLLDDCGSSLSFPFWTGTYTPGEADNLVLQVCVNDGSEVCPTGNATGWIKMARNGVLVASSTGPTFHANTGGDPWWNFGVYKWRWELPNAGGSLMTQVQDSIGGMTLYKQ